MAGRLDSPTSIVQIGGSEFRLPSRFTNVFLMPPDYRSYVAADVAARKYLEYDLFTGELCRTFLGPDRYGVVSRPSSSGTRIARQSKTAIEVIDLSDEKIVFMIPAGPDPVRFALAPSGDRLAVAVPNPETKQREADFDMEGEYVGAVVVHFFEPELQPREFRPLANFAANIEFSPDGRHLAVCGEWQEEYVGQPKPFAGSELVQVWDVATGAEMLRLILAEACSSAYVVFGGGFLLVNSAGKNRPFALYDLATGKQICEYSAGYPRLQQAVLSPDGNRIVGVHSSGDIVRWDSRTGAEIDITPCPFQIFPCSYSVYDGFTREIGFRADGTIVVLRQVEMSVEVWAIPDGRLTRLLGGTVPITAMAFAKSGREILTAACRDTVVRRWDTQTGKLLCEINLPDDVATCCVSNVWIGPGGRIVAQSTEGLAVFCFDTGETRLTPTPVGEARLGKSLSADGWHVGLAIDRSQDWVESVRIEKVITGAFREVYRFDSETTAVAAAYDRGRVLLLYDDRQGERRTLVCLKVDAAQTEILWSRTLPIGPESSRGSLHQPAIVWSIDGTTALVVPNPNRVPFVIDAATGEALSKWVTAIGQPLAVHPSRPILATADGDSLILADWRTGTQMAVIHDRFCPHALAWSPDGAQLAASLPDGTARIFTVGHFKQVN